MTLISKILIILGIITVSAIVGTIFASLALKRTRTPSSIPPTDTNSKRTEDKKKGWRGLGSVWGWGVCIGVVVLLTWWLTSHHEQKKEAEPITVTSSGIAAVQPKEEWVFIWNLPPGQYDRGLNSNTLEVRIEKNDPESLWFDTLYKSGGSMKVSHQQLSKNGDRFIGSWSQNDPRDGGEIYLNKVGEQIWVGQETDRSGRTFACTLKRK